MCGPFQSLFKGTLVLCCAARHRRPAVVLRAVLWQSQCSLKFLGVQCPVCMLRGRMLECQLLFVELSHVPS